MRELESGSRTPAPKSPCYPSPWDVSIETNVQTRGSTLPSQQPRELRSPYLQKGSVKNKQAKQELGPTSSSS